MSENRDFTKAIENLKSKGQYVNLLKKFGRHFIINQAQCDEIMKLNGSSKNECDKVRAIITKFWSGSTTIEYFKQDCWAGHFELDRALVLAGDHPILFPIIRQKAITEN